MIKDKEIEREPIEYRKYDDFELNHFNELVQKYYYDYTIETGPEKGQTIKILNKDKLMTDYGAINKIGAVILEGVYEDKFNHISFYKQPTRIQQLENLYDQWQQWKDRMGYGEKKKLEQLDEIASQIGHLKFINK